MVALTSLVGECLGSGEEIHFIGGLQCTDDSLNAGLFNRAF
jgi:hypothetical protein